MIPGESAQERETAFLVAAIDPIAQAVLDASEPWDAYNAANNSSGALIDDMHWMPHGGDLYVAWAELTDLYATGKTPIEDAHAALQAAAASWLDRSALPDAAFIDGWLTRATEAANSLVKRDGNWWHPPS